MFHLPSAGSLLLVPLAIPHASEALPPAVRCPATAVCDLTGEREVVWSPQTQEWTVRYEVSDDEDPAISNHMSAISKTISRPK